MHCSGRFSMMIKVSVVMAISLFVGGMTLSSMAAAEDKPIELKMSYQHGTKGGKHIRGHKPWSEMIEKATNGKVKITLYPSDSLAKANENYDATVDGIVDIGWIAIPQYPGRFPLSAVFDVPGPSFKTSEAASLAFWQLFKEFPEIQAEWADVKVLFFHANMPLTVATVNKPINSINDLKGMKVRCAGPGATGLFKEAGASPLYCSPSDMFLNMEKGVIDGVMIAFEGLKSFGVAKLANYYATIPTFSGPHFAMIMNKDKWDSLPPDVQQAFWSVCDDFGSRFYGKADDASNKEVEDEEVAAGKKNVILNEPEWEGHAQRVQEQMLADLEGKGLPARKIFKRLMELGAEANK